MPHLPLVHPEDAPKQAQVVYAVYANIIADATAMDQDEMFDTL